MKHWTQIIRSWIAVLVGVGYLGSLPGVTLALAGVVMDHGHEHGVEMVEHQGHTDFVFNHSDGHEDHSEEGHPRLEGLHINAHPQDCHVVQLPADTASLIVKATMIQFQPATVGLIDRAAASLLTAWRLADLPVRARPPPVIGRGLLTCLRTTVLLV